jgi:cysteine rich repeat protein
VKPALSLAALLILMGAASPAAARQPTQAQIGAIRSACRGDYQAHCSGVQPGGPEALACLKKNIAALSVNCQKAVAATGVTPASKSQAPLDKPAVAAAPAAAPAAPTPAAPALAAPTPSTPIGAATAIPPAEASAPAGPAPRPATASAPAARARMAVPGTRPAVPLRVEIAVMRQACGADYEANCAGVRPGGGQVIACLVAKQAVLSPPCRRALALAQQGM